MGFFKGFGLGVLSLLLFLSLFVFALAFTLNSTVLNAHFINSGITKLDVSDLVEDVLAEENLRQGIGTALVTAISKEEPRMKEQVKVAVDEVYDYLKGKTENLDLPLTLKNTVLSSDFMVSVVDELDMPTIIKDPLRDRIIEEVPADSEYITPYIDGSLDEIITELTPWMKQQMSAAVEPITDYLLGRSQSFKLIISWGPVLESLRDHVRPAFLQFPPPEFTMLSQAELEQEFDEFYLQFSVQVPSTFTFDESLFGDTPTNIADALTEAEEVLGNSRQYIHYFQIGCLLMIVFMLLVVVGIALINRNVRITTLSLGVIALIDGIFGFVGVYFIDRFLASRLSQIENLPSSLRVWVQQMAGDSMSPMRMFSIGLIAGGVVLIIVSIIYWRKAKAEAVENLKD